MPDFSAMGFALACGLWAILAVAFATWLASLAKSDVSIVDSIWSILILLAGVAYALTLPANGPRAPWVMALALAQLG